MIEAATNYRLLTPRATLTGLGDSLANVITNVLPDGALCWVLAEESLWRFSRHSTAAVSSTVIATSRGAGVPGRWIEYGAGGGGGTNVLSVTLDEAVTIEVVTPFEQLGNLELELAAGFETVTALLVVNSGSNDSFGIGLRITYSTDQMIWTPLPGASLIDNNSLSSRNHLSVMGTLTGAAGFVRAEWSATGDEGDWTILADENGSATLTAWQS